MLNSTRFNTLSPLAIGTALLAAGSLLMPASAAPLELSVFGDAFISADSPTTNYDNGGNVNNMNVHEGGAGYAKDRYTFLRFDLSPYTGGVYSGSSLTLQVQDISPDNDQNFDIYGIPDLGADEDFDETALTFNNSAYTYDSSDNQMDTSGFTFIGSYIGVSPSDEGTGITLSSAALDTFLNNDTNNIATFVLTNTNGDGFINKFDSKNASSGGSTLTVVPEPSSVVMVGLGLLAAFGLARKRRG